MPDENGFTVNQWLCRQTENAQHNKGMIYQADWIGSTDHLSPFGKKQLGRWTKLRGVQPALYVESSGDSFLDSQRQSAISGYLAQSGSTIQPELIQLVYADDGLEGEEVPAIADRFLGERTNSGQSGFGSFGSSSGFSPGGQPGGFF